jgi:hypothetical protein
MRLLFFLSRKDIGREQEAIALFAQDAAGQVTEADSLVAMKVIRFAAVKGIKRVEGLKACSACGG